MGRIPDEKKPASPSSSLSSFPFDEEQDASSSSSCYYKEQHHDGSGDGIDYYDDDNSTRSSTCSSTSSLEEEAIDKDDDNDNDVQLVIFRHTSGSSRRDNDKQEERAVAPVRTSSSSSSSSRHETLRRRSMMDLVKLLVGVLGVYGAYLTYGMVVEDLYRYRSPVDGSAFTYVWFLQVLESGSSIVLGMAGRKICGGRDDLNLRPFLLAGSSQVFAKVFMSLALVAGASYPVAMLAKSGKIVPVMIGQLLLGGSKYKFLDYLFAALVVIGTLLLSLGNDRKTSVSAAVGNDGSMAGVIFILLSLVMDGCTAGLQKKLKQQMEHTPPTTYDFVLYSHLSMVSVALVIALCTGDMTAGWNCLANDPAILWMVLTVCFLSVVGQSFIFFVISTFDPLVCATITTTRKMWSVLLSIAFKGHHLTTTGYSGLGIALVGLMIELHGKARKTFSCDKHEYQKLQSEVRRKFSCDKHEYQKLQSKVRRTFSSDKHEYQRLQSKTSEDEDEELV